MGKQVSGVTMARIFDTLMTCGYLTKAHKDVIINEIIRGRLTCNYVEVKKVADILVAITNNGLTCKDIIILRSLYFSFEEIYEFSKKRQIGLVAWVISEYGIQNPEIESVVGQTSDSLNPDFVSYRKAIQYNPKVA